MRSVARCAIFFALVVVIGCEKKEAISFYSAPKDPPTTAPVMMMADGAAAPVPPPVQSAAPQSASPIEWTVPTGWKQLPGSQMRVASFRVSEANPAVQLTVIPLGMEAGELLGNVNRWEQQIGLAASPADKLDSIVKKSKVNGLDIATVDLLGAESASPRMQMLAAIVPYGGQVWFFKLAGPADVVGKQKENFDAYVASLKPGGAGGAAQQQAAGAAPPAPQELPPGHPPLAGAAPPAVAGALPPGHPPLVASSMKLASYKAGDDWKPIPGEKQFRIVAFSMGEGDAAGELVVTRLASNNAGSFLDNINRWRAQIALPPVADAREIAMTDTKAGDQPAVVLQIDNPGGAGAPAKRMVVALASVGTDLWFIKLTAPPATLDKQRPAFDAFLKSMQFAPEGAESK